MNKETSVELDQAAPADLEVDRREAIKTSSFSAYQKDIIHQWLQTITVLSFVLVPLFFVLDVFIAPRELLPRFATYRAISAFAALVQHLIVRNTKPSRFSFLHGYFVSFQVGGFIALMTTHLGGFESGYYPGLIMVIIGVNLLMPWKATHTAANTFLILGMYVGLNLALRDTFRATAMANNLFFLAGTGIISVAITHVRYRLLQVEFSLLLQLKKARDSLWSEMELAKRVQVALLPAVRDVTGYQIGVAYTPAREVGGDYYDIIETDSGARYLAIGDVAGHGLDSGLIMMMAQTSVISVIKGHKDCSPVEVLSTTNRVLRENVGRLGSNHYMTMSVLKLEEGYLTVSGHHQDLLVYRKEQDRVESIDIPGSWLGIVDALEDHLETITVHLKYGDRVLLFSDGVTEATSETGEMFGQERLAQTLAKNAKYPLSDAVHNMLNEVNDFQASQDDDMTLILMTRR